ncbi:ABC transporter substrate-binding protein [Ruania alba]|nr:sugar ABC transporter substrate-binding protein [Ruania alba]
MSWDTTSDTALYRVAELWAGSADAELDVQSVPYSDYDAKLRTVLSSGAAPHAIRINDDYVRGYHADGALLDLTPYLERDGIVAEDFFPVAFNFPVQADGTHAAWPIMTNPGVLYINVDAFEEAGVPLPPSDWTMEGWTWDEFLEAAKALTLPDGERWGCLITDGTDFETVWPVNNGSDGIYSMDGTRFTLAEDEALEALQWGADLALVHGVHPDFATVDAGSSTPNWANTQFATGKIAMMLSLTSAMDWMVQNVTDMRWDIVAPPGRVQQKTVNTLTVLAIPADSPDPDLAWEFLKSATEDPAIEVFAESRGFVPVRREAADFFASDDADSSPQNLALVPEAVENAVNENYNPYIERARTIYRPVLDEIWSGRQSAADALGAIKAEVEAVLAGEQ